MQHWRLGWIGLVIGAIGSPVSAADTLESVQKTIIEHSKTFKTLSSHSTYVTDEKNESMTLHSRGTTSYEYIRRERVPLYRVETTYSTVMETGGTKQSMMGSTLTICDGEHLLIYSDNNGTKSVMKQKAHAQGGLIDQSYFDTMAQSYHLELLPEAKVGSHTAYVIKAVLKQAQPVAAIEQVLYFDKKTGVMLKSLSKNAEGKITTEMTTTDLKVNSSISPDRFVFHAPEGVPVTDLTQHAAYDEPSDGAKTSGTHQPDKDKSKPAAEKSSDETNDAPGKADDGTKVEK